MIKTKIFILISFALLSCKKEQHCECKNNNGDTLDHILKWRTINKAKKICNDLSKNESFPQGCVLKITFNNTSIPNSKSKNQIQCFRLFTQGLTPATLRVAFPSLRVERGGLNAESLS